jgi:hypothetical protein
VQGAGNMGQGFKCLRNLKYRVCDLKFGIKDSRFRV